MKRQAVTNLSVGVLLGLIGLGAVVVSAYWITEHSEYVAEAISPFAGSAGMDSHVTSGACAARLQSIGLEAAPSGDEVFVTLNDFPEPDTATALSSLALYVCSDHALESYCLGATCSSPLTMRLAIR